MMPSAEASQVSVRARSSAALAEPQAECVVEQHVGDRVAELVGRGEHAGDAVDDAAAVAADVGGDRRRAARRRPR